MKPQKVVFPDSVGFRCLNCGVCCHMQPPDVDNNERKAIQAKGFRDFLAPPDETGIMWIRRKKDDSCFFLGKDNKCQIYNVRPSVCKLEPFTIADFDLEAGTIELQLNFPFSACCLGVNEKCINADKNEIAKAAQTLMEKVVALTAKDMELPINDQRVLAETRSRLLRRNVEAADLQL